MLAAFIGHMLCAQTELSFAQAVTGLSWAVAACHENAAQHLRAALAEANAMRDRKRAGLCLKALHWIRLAA